MILESSTAGRTLLHDSGHRHGVLEKLKLIVDAGLNEHNVMLSSTPHSGPTILALSALQHDGSGFVSEVYEAIMVPLPEPSTSH